MAPATIFFLWQKWFTTRCTPLNSFSENSKVFMIDESLLSIREEQTVFLPLRVVFSGKAEAILFISDAICSNLSLAPFLRSLGKKSKPRNLKLWFASQIISLQKPFCVKTNLSSSVSSKLIDTILVLAVFILKPENSPNFSKISSVLRIVSIDS